MARITFKQFAQSPIEVERRLRQAKQLGRQSWRLRYILSCPYQPGSPLADAWHAGRIEARRAKERPVVDERAAAAESLVDRLNKYFSGSMEFEEIE